MNDKIRLFNPDAKIYLDYDLRILWEILVLVRNETGSLAAQVLREYEDTLIEAARLEESERVREAEQRINEVLNKEIE